jgi:HTH-type transcriptional regulator / antitoxin HigA
MWLESRITTEVSDKEYSTMNARVPAEVFPPGDFLAEELDARGWSQTELAEILGRPHRLVNEIIAGKRAITPETAKGLAAAFGASAQYWMNLETTYQLSKAQIAEQEVSRRAKLYGMFPVKELIKRGWIETSENTDVVEQRFLEFFGMSSLDDSPKFAHAARKTEYTSVSSKIQLAWLNRAKQVAKAVRVTKYSDRVLREAILQMRSCIEYTDEIKNVSTILGGAGVRLVIVEHLPGSKMDGACFWIDGSPVIALSLRFDRVDNFWFSLFHEIDHILNGEGKDQPIYELIEQDASSSDLPQNEVRANKAAANYCIPTEQMEDFVARHDPLFSKAAILGFARRLHVHPGVAVGQLQGRKLIPFSFHRDMLEKIRAVVTLTVLTDGFGNKISL